MHVRRIAVLGAGPIGLEAALAFREQGHDVHVYERDRVGSHLTRWGHVRLFSSWSLNHSRRGAHLLEREGVELPSPDAYLTGAEHRERYLIPLAKSCPLAGRIHEETEVLHVGRDGLGKADLIGGARETHPFRLLLQRQSGEEETVEADVVVDCTGTYGNANWMGSGNLPAPGERALRERIRYHLVDLEGAEREHYRGTSVLLVGSGHSAATALDALLLVPDTTVHWVPRRRDPLEVIVADPLLERKRLSERANALSRGEHPRVRVHPGALVDAVASRGDGFEVELRSGEHRERLEVDRILAHVGYRPNRRIHRELQVNECYATEAPMKLAAALLGESSSDCLAQRSKGVETLLHPEPDFFTLGAKSYGRTSNFLVRVGLQQVEELSWLLASRRPREHVS